MSKIHDGKKWSCRKKVNSKMLSVWVNCAEKWKGNQCVVKSEFSDDWHIIEMGHVIA